MGQLGSKTAACVYYGDECGLGPSGLCKCRPVTCALQKADVKAGWAAARALRPPRGSTHACLGPGHRVASLAFGDTGHQGRSGAMTGTSVSAESHQTWPRHHVTQGERRAGRILPFSSLSPTEARSLDTNQRATSPLCSNNNSYARGLTRSHFRHIMLLNVHPNIMRKEAY